jgi:hypothetical protein
MTYSIKSGDPPSSNTGRYLTSARQKGGENMNYLNDLAKTLDKSYAKLPALPKGARDFISQMSPWLALIFGVLAILAGITAFNSISFFSSLAVIAGASGFAFSAILSMIILVIEGVIELMAYSPLKAGKVKGWNLLYYGLILSLVSSIVYLNVSSIISSLIGALIGYYFLYQIKSYYK